MNTLKTRFEKELKTKLLFKTSPHMTEEVLLLKAFKYFDSYNSDKCDSEIFKQTMAKIGVISLTSDELDKLFQEYSNNQPYLDYKNFIGEVFNNSSLLKNKRPEEEQNAQNEQHEQQAPENDNNESDPVDDILEKLRKKLSTRGLTNLISLEGNCRILDENNQQTLDYSMFKKICYDFDFELNEDEIQLVFDGFDREENGQINYDDFIRVLRGELNDKRKELVQNLFKALDIENKGELTMDELFSIYNPRESFECAKKGVSEDEAMQIFVNTFAGNHKYLNGDEGINKPVDMEEFEDYYESVSLMIPDDDIFREVLLKSWGLIKEEPKEEPPKEQEMQKEPEKQIQNEEKPKEEQNINKENEPVEQREEEQKIDTNINVKKEIDPVKAKILKEKEFRKKLLNEENLDAFRNKIGAKGIKVIMNFVNLLRQYDRKGNKELEYTNFSDAILNSNINYSEEEISDLFKDFVNPETKTINYGEFLKELVGDLNERRQNIVNVAFKKLDTENCGIINLSDIKECFNSKNSPLVRDAITSEEAFYNDFMESFQTHHNIFRSPKIKKVNFAEFEDYYKFVSIAIDDDYLFEEMIIACWKLSKSKYAHAGPRDNVNILMHQENENIKPEEDDLLKNELSVVSNKGAKRCFPSKSKGTPYGIDEKATDYSNQLHPKGELVGIKLNKNDDIITAFRKKLILRGPRGVMSLRRTAMLYDVNKNYKLSRDQFHKYIEDYRLDLTPEEEEKLFNSFAKNRSSEIDYEQFVKGIVGKMNHYRTQVIQRVFEKLDSEKTGKVKYDDMISNYNPDKHPEVLNGSRTKEEILGRFIDLVEYHFNLLNKNKDKDYANMDEFIEFYNYLSMFIEDDKYFENLMARVWELGCTENYAKSYKLIKRKNIF